MDCCEFSGEGFDSAICLGIDTAIESVADASISVPGELDHYCFTLTVSAALSVFTGGPADGDTLLYIYDEAGRQIDFDDDGGEGRYSQIFRMFDAGTYYIVVGAKADAVIDRYSLSVDVSELIIEPPAVVSVKASNTAPTNQSVTVTAVFNVFSAVRQYRIDDGDWMDYSDGVVVTENCTVSFRGIDEDRNVSEIVSYTVSNIDDMPPEVLSVTADVTTPTNRPVTVTATFSDDAVVKQYGWRTDTATWVTDDNGFARIVHEYTYEWLDYADGVEVGKNGTVYFRAVDEAGNVSEIASYSVYNIDTRTPVLVSVKADIIEPTNRDVTLTVEFDDTCQIQYSLDGETWIDVETFYIPPLVGGDVIAINLGGGGFIQISKIWYGSVTVSANTTVCFRAVDEAGNTSEIASYEVANIDKTAPEKPVVSADVTTPTNGDVTVTAVFSDDSVVRQYSMDGSTWLDCTAAVVMTANGVVYFRAFDAVGNVSEVTAYEVANIDRVAPEPPVAAADVTAPTNRSVTVTAEFGDKAVVKQYRIGEDGDWLDYADGAVMTDNGVVYFRGIDAEGNISNFTAYVVDNIDRTPPEKPIAFNWGIGSPTRYNVTIKANFSADTVRKEYRINDGEWREYVNGAEMADNGFVYFRGFDEAGNVSDVTVFEVTNVDRTPPSPPTVSADVTTPTNGDVTLTATCGDDAVKIQYTFDDSYSWYAGWKDYTGYMDGVVMSENGTVYFRAVDRAGNTSYVTRYTVANIDRTAPDKPAVSADVTTLTNGDVTVTAVFDADSARKEYRIDDGDWLDYADGVVMSENGTVYFRAVDEAGNMSEVASYEVANIDKTAPEKPAVSADVTTPTNGDVAVTAVFSDDSVARQYSFDGETWLDCTAAVVMTANGVVYFRAFDAVGNMSEIASYEVANIDRVAPESPVAAADVTAPTNRSVTVTAEFGDKAVAGQYRIGEDGEWVDYVDGAVMTDNGVVYFRGISAEGNVSNLTAYIVDNIDMVPPDQPVAAADVTAPTNRSVTVTAVFDADSARKEYRIDDGDWLDYADAVVMSDNGVVYFRAFDEAGNMSEVASYEVANIDKTAPEKPAVSADVTTPTNGDVAVTAVFSDDSVARQYSFDGETWLDCTAAVVMTANGVVYFRAFDEAGNMSEVASYEVANIVSATDAGTSDLNGDGRADIVMTITKTTHPHVGATGAWLIQENQTAAWGDLSQRNAGWTIFGKGLTTAGKTTADVYLKSDGNIVGAWTTGADGKVTGWTTVGEFDSNTQVLGLGDFDGDGQTDLLLRNTNGAVGCHLTDGTGWHYFQSLGSEWKIAAVGDLNGDGRDDVVLKHDAGFAGSWLTQRDCTMAWANLDTLQRGFEIVGTGDFNGDGTDDVLLKNGNYYGAWLVRNGNAAGWFGIGDLGNVSVEEIADYDADGIDDLRIRTAAGDLGAQLVKGADTLQWKYYGSVGQEWSTSLAAI